MKDFVYRLAVRLFLPHLHESLKHEDAASLFKAGTPEYVVVENRGSDKTIFSFAGAAMLYAGMPAFEFRNMLRNVAEDYNLVFYRDVYRMLYHIGPQGQPDGLAFYQTDIRRIVDTLGSRHNVSIGASAGAGAAVYFGTQCGFDKILAFNQPLPSGIWSNLSTQFYNYCNVRKLVQHPGEYTENALISLAAKWLQIQLRRAGIEEGWDPFAVYKAAPQRPPMTVFYGARCACDARNAERLRDLPEAKLVPLPVGLHNCATYLKRQNALAETIRTELEEIDR